MAKRKTRTVYYARKRLTLRYHGEDVGTAMPGDLVDVTALELTRGEIRMLVEDVAALRAVDVDEETEPEPESIPPWHIPASEPEEESLQ